MAVHGSAEATSCSIASMAKTAGKNKGTVAAAFVAPLEL
jgi:hypothetical protein